MKETRESHRSAREGFEARLISAADTRLQANAPSFSADGHACRWQRGGEALGSRPSPHAHNLLGSSGEAHATRAWTVLAANPRESVISRVKRCRCISVRGLLRAPSIDHHHSSPPPNMDLIRPVLAASSLSARRTRPARALRPMCQFIHSTSPRTATPLPHPTVPGPPPQPPQAAAGQAEDRIARKKNNAELLQRGQALKVNPSKPSSALQKRFWKDVSVKETPGTYQPQILFMSHH